MEYHQFLLLALSRPGTHDRGFSLRGLVANGRLLPLHVAGEGVGSPIGARLERVAVKQGIGGPCRSHGGYYLLLGG